MTCPSSSPKTRAALAKRVAKKTLYKPDKKRFIAKRENSKKPKRHFRPGGVQAANGSHPLPAVFTLRPVRSGIRRQRMANRLIDEGFWRSPRLAGIPFEVKALYNYLITQAGTTGFIYKTQAEHIALLDISPDLWQRGLDTLRQRGRIGVDIPNSLIWVCNQLKHQYQPAHKISPNQDKGMRNELSRIPASSTLLQFLDRYKDRIKSDCPETSKFFDSFKPSNDTGWETPIQTPLPTPMDTPPSTIVLVSALASASANASESLKNKDKDIPAKSPQSLSAIKESFTEQELEQNKKAVAVMVNQLAEGMTAFPKKQRSKGQKLLDGEIEQVQAAYRHRFGKQIQPSQVMLLVNGRNGKHYNAWNWNLTLIEFIKDCPEVLEDPLAWLIEAAKNPQTVARYEKRALGE